MFRAFIILTHPSVLQELDFIFCTRGGGSWYFRLTGGLANFTPIAGMGHLISKPKFKASSTRIRKFVKTQIFFYEYGLRPHVSSVFSGRIRKFLKTLSRMEIFLSDTITYTCARSYPEIFEYAFVILLDPVFTASIINKHGVQQGCSFFVSCSDF